MPRTFGAMNTTPSYSIRAGRPDDIPAVHALICELAVFEKAGDEVSVSEQDLLADGFGNDAIFTLIIAEWGGEVVGMALWYEKYSTWKGRCGYLEDLVVRVTHRGKGIGKALFESCARAISMRGFLRMEWQVLTWNKPAIGFYQALGAELDPEWMNGKLSGEALREYGG